MRHENTVPNSAMKPDAPPVLSTARDQSCDCICFKHYSLRTELALAIARMSPDDGFARLS